MERFERLEPLERLDLDTGGKMLYRGLRDWLAKVDKMGELRTLEGIDWNLEMGAVVDVLYREHPPYPPALIFDKIKDHAQGFRALFGHFASPKRIALTLGITQEFDHVLEFVRVYHEKIKHCVPIPREEVKSGEVHENVQERDEVNLLKFPAPFLHEKDGGRYIGTGHLVITKDPDSNWINVGTYRMMLHDHNTAGIYIGPGKHASIHRQKYFAKGAPVPINVVLGSEPLMWFASCCPVAAGLSEFDFAGGLAGEALQVVTSDITGLPYPADAEIVLEGEMRPGEFKGGTFWRVARLLCQRKTAGALYARQARALSQRSHSLGREPGAPTAHPHSAAGYYALRACLGRARKSRRPGCSRRMVARAGTTAIHGGRYQTTISRSRQASWSPGCAVLFRRLSKPLHHCR
ncbi:MAG TPA: UbiD family decarboxylase [Candidatus Binatia bacterium]